MSIRFSFGGDEHIFAEVSEEMSLEAFFTSLSMTNAVKQAGIKGVTEICPANACFQIKYDPDMIKPSDLLRELKSMEGAASKSDATLKTRIIEIPVYYNDPWTHETLMRFRERHQDPNATDLEYAAADQRFGQRRGFHAGPFQPAVVRLDGRLRRRPAVPVSDGRTQTAVAGAEISAPAHRYAEADRRLMAVASAASIRCAVRAAIRCSASRPMPIYDPTSRLATCKMRCACSALVTS